MNLVTRKGNQLFLNGNVLTGDTYAIKGEIKKYLGGKWNSEAKAWTIDTDKLEKYLSGNSIGLMKDERTAGEAVAAGGFKVKVRTGNAGSNGWCDKCHSYCWGDCTA